MLDELQIKNLLQFQNTTSPCVTIQIPTYRTGNAQEDKLRFKNALTDATDQLTNNDYSSFDAMSKNKATGYLADAYELLDKEDFWNHLSDSLVMFIAENKFEYFLLPKDLSPMVYVNDHFYLRHLLPLTNKNNRFFVLALSQNETRFFDCQQYSITPVMINDLVPSGMEELVGTDDLTRNLQSHSGGSSDRIHHGHGAGKDDKNENVKKYFREVDKGLMEMLHDENVPLVIYSVDNQIALYEEISNYSNVHTNHVSGNPENEDPVMIHEKAWKAVKEHFDKMTLEKKENFNQALSEDKASFSVIHILPDAINGKVDTLFIANNTSAFWGTYDKTSNKVSIQKDRTKESTCLLNLAAISTYSNGGEIFEMDQSELPRAFAPVNATFRY